MESEVSVLPYESQQFDGSFAAEAVNVHKSYGSGRNKVAALQGATIRTPTGTIYGLLGPSGCGKTTLLRCIIGRLQVDSGYVQALGHKPGIPKHGVPGKLVGYMPQELAMWMDLSIDETLTFFGRLHGMKKAYIKQRMAFLLEFLSLPEESRLIRQLSGGQQRRTSFAIALLQEPKLLVLDEPTVGVDPLLRLRIWEHMLDIVRSGTTTIIITTHYVEEARQAHNVGLMRNGALLAEANPEELMRIHTQNSLEDVFLTLCSNDQTNRSSSSHVNNDDSRVSARKRRESGTKEERTSLLSSLCEDQPIRKTKSEKVSCCGRCLQFTPSGMNVFALFLKNILFFKRNPGFLLFEFLLPSFQIVLFCLCVGGKPFNLNIAVVNNETCSSMDHMASCLYLDHLDNHTIVQLNYSENFDEAYQLVKDGKAWGILEMGPYFTPNLITRYSYPKLADNVTVENSTIHMYLDQTNQQIAVTIQLEVTTAFQSLMQSLSQMNISFSAESGQMPIKMEEPVYGDADPSFTDFMAPGIILSITFFMATGLTALNFVLERKQGMLDRVFVAGVNTTEVMLGHICTQFFVMFVQVSLLLIFALGVFGVTYKGPLILVVLLTLFQGLTGMSLGLLISCFCNEEMSAIQAALGSVYPNMLISGLIWPVQAMPIWLRYISYCLPMTFAAEAMRSILGRGWGLEQSTVWIGFLVSLGWGWLFMILSAVVLIIKKD